MKTTFRKSFLRDLKKIKSKAIPMTKKQNDPVIDEIREVRHRISERCGHDPAELVAHYMELQERSRDRLVEPAKTGERTVDFHVEVELLKNNTEFMALMKQLSQENATISLQDLRRELGL